MEYTLYRILFVYYRPPCERREFYSAVSHMIIPPAAVFSAVYSDFITEDEICQMRKLRYLQLFWLYTGQNL